MQKPRVIGGIQIRNTRDLINENTRICQLIYAPAKFGKTTYAATLNYLTQEQLGKPSLFIAVEAGDGGGTMSIQDMGVDYVQPQDYNELSRVITQLKDDSYYGGVILDSASEAVNLYIKPRALKENFPGSDKYPTRVLGVPARNDYQSMGELVRQLFSQLISMTTNRDITKRKHLVVTALLKEKTDEYGNILRICPDLPGAMSDTATAMFQTVSTIAIVHHVIPDPENPKRTLRKESRVLQVTPEDKKVLGDRTGCFPNFCELNLLTIWKKYWIPKLTKEVNHAETT